jgi:hypothetical protein
VDHQKVAAAPTHASLANEAGHHEEEVAAAEESLMESIDQHRRERTMVLPRQRSSRK